MESGRDDGRAGWAMADLVACSLQLVVAGASEYCAADASACPKAFVGRVDDRVCVKICDADFSDFYSAHASTFRGRRGGDRGRFSVSFFR